MNRSLPRDTAVFILAGGRGERLDLLTARRAKPAVPFGGTFRVVDFVLSNCFHAGLSDVSILTQYMPRSLEDHVGFGRSWDLDRVESGLTYLHPFRGLDKSNWYGGTANALYENVQILEESRAELFLILSGDHIYRMDYRELLESHVESRAPVSVGVRRVAPELASHCGIFEVDSRGRATGFQEKPAEPRSDLASMGIYVLERDFLLDILKQRGPQEPELDFGRDLLPGWVSRGEIAIHPFTGYWLDIGTLDSYFMAHGDLLGRQPVFRLNDPDWPIITRSLHRAPMHMAASAKIEDSLISEGCNIQGHVVRSILGPGVRVEEGATVVNAIVMQDSLLGRGSLTQRSILDKRVRIGDGCRIGEEGAGLPNQEKPKVLFSGLTLLAKDSIVPAGFTLGRNIRWSLGEPVDWERRWPDRKVPDGASVLA